MTSLAIPALFAAVILSVGNSGQRDAQVTVSAQDEFAVSPEDATALAAFEAARLPALPDTPTQGDIYGYAGTVVFYYVGGYAQAAGSLIAIDRICDPDPTTPGRGQCDWHYRYAALQAPLTDPAVALPPGALDLRTAYGRDCAAIAEVLGELQIGPDPRPHEIWMGSQPVPDSHDRQHRRLELQIGPAYSPAGQIILEGRESAFLRNLAVLLQRPLRDCDLHD